ncbi:MAG: PAS domain-containing protein [Firmicutes bacterium]|nr:PAS domain-containing protein [Bacillota bacterium]
MLNNIIFGLLNITCIILVFIVIKIAKYKNKIRIQWLAFAIMVMIFTYCSGVLLQMYAKIILGHTLTGLLYYYAFGLNYISAFYFVFIILFIRPETKLNWKFALLFIAPTIFYGLVLTNNYHHYFYVKYEIDHTVVFGKYIFITGIYSLILHGIMFGYLIYYSINNFKLYFKQSLIIILSMSISFIVNLLIMFKVVGLPLYANAASAGLGPLIIYFGILRYHFLEISPLSLKIILNSISDAFVVLDKNSIIIGYNQTFANLFNMVETSNRVSFFNICNESELNRNINQAFTEKRKITFEKSITCQGINQYFMIDVLPIINNQHVMGTVVLFKDITELNQKNLQLQQLLEEQRQQAEMIEELAVTKERNRMAGEVHDTLGHTITLIIALLETGLICINKNQIDEGKIKLKMLFNMPKMESMN